MYVGHWVVMSMDTYDKQLELQDVYQKLETAKKQMEEGGPLLSGNEVFQRLHEKRGK